MQILDFGKTVLDWILLITRKVSSDQILDVNVSNATGYLSKLLNAGKIENKGIELQLTVTPVKAGAFPMGYRS